MSYCDALGIRAFADGKSLAEDLAELRFNAMAELVHKPLINLESAANHPCQALADWKTMDDLKVPAGGRFVLSWVYHPRALPLAVPAAAVHMAASRGMEVIVLRPEGFALPAPHSRQGAPRSRASLAVPCARPNDRDEALAGARIVYAKEWGSTQHYGDSEARCSAARAHSPTGACARAGLRAPRTDCRLMHCLPVRRNTAVADEVLDGPRSIVQLEAANRLSAADGRSLPTAQRGQSRMISMNRGDQTLAIRALKSAAPYIRMYKGKVFVVKASGGVFGDSASTRALIEQIGILHYFGVRVVMVHGGDPSSRSSPRRSVCRRAWCKDGA